MVSAAWSTANSWRRNDPATFRTVYCFIYETSFKPVWSSGWFLLYPNSLIRPWSHRLVALLQNALLFENAFVKHPSFVMEHEESWNHFTEIKRRGVRRVVMKNGGLDSCSNYELQNVDYQAPFVVFTPFWTGYLTEALLSPTFRELHNRPGNRNNRPNKATCSSCQADQLLKQFKESKFFKF